MEKFQLEASNLRLAHGPEKCAKKKATEINTNKIINSMFINFYSMVASPVHNTRCLHMKKCIGRN